MAREYTERLEVRVTPQQRQFLEAIATQQGINLSQVIRQRALKERNRSLTGVNRDIYLELTRMGNNLNQVARVLNYHSLVQKTLPASTLLELKEAVKLAYGEIETLKKQLKL